jgi:hypothetical protein
VALSDAPRPGHRALTAWSFGRASVAQTALRQGLA